MDLASHDPKFDPQDDALGRAPQAKHLASVLWHAKSKEGVAFSVTAPWGAGKTSFLYMVEHYLKELGAQPPAERKGEPFIIIRFNPWWLQRSASLSESFIQEFAKTLKYSDHSDIQKIGDEMAKYGEAIGATVALSLATVGVAIPGVGWAVNKGMQKFKTDPLTLEQRRENVATALRRSGARFLVLIDDIDRLDPPQIREIFDATKTLGGLPGVTYLLAYDAKIAEQAIAKVLGVDGRAYLEKIVPVSRRLPTVSPDQMAEYVEQRLAALRSEVDPSSTSLSKGKAIPFIETLLLPYLKQPRDLERLLSTMEFTFPAAQASGADFYAFSAVETLRLFDEELYDFLALAAAKSSLPTDWVSDEHKEILRKKERRSIVGSLMPRFLSGFYKSGLGASFGDEREILIDSEASPLSGKKGDPEDAGNVYFGFPP